MSFLNQSSEDPLGEAINKHLDSLRSRLERESGNIHDVEAQRKKLEAELKLGDYLYTFMHDIHLSCAWDDNARKQNGGRLWRNKVVAREEAERTETTRDHSSYNRPYAPTDEERNRRHPVTIYKFECQQLPHKVVLYEDYESFSTPDEHVSYQILEVYKQDRVVFMAHCYEDHESYTKHAIMTAFIPGLWVEVLLKKCRELEIEQKEFELKDEYRPEKLEQLKRNYIE